MKKRNEKMVLSIAVLTLGLSLFPMEAAAQMNKQQFSPVTINPALDNKESISYPDAQAIGWRYKSVNGKVYRRQYNYSREKWIGEWELC